MAPLIANFEPLTESSVLIVALTVCSTAVFVTSLLVVVFVCGCGGGAKKKEEDADRPPEGDQKMPEPAPPAESEPQAPQAPPSEEPVEGKSAKTALELKSQVAQPSTVSISGKGADLQLMSQKGPLPTIGGGAKVSDASKKDNPSLQLMNPKSTVQPALPPGAKVAGGKSVVANVGAKSVSVAASKSTASGKSVTVAS